MNFSKLKERLKQNKLCLIIILVLLVFCGIFFSESQNYKYTLLYQYQTIPDIELKNTLYQTEYGFSGEVSGFVKFDNLADQPKDARQYYTIRAQNRFDENLSQYFSLEEIIKMNYLSPRSLGVSELITVSDTNRTLTLEDENGNKFFIDKITEEVSMRDVTGDNTTLITDDSDYEDFIKSWLLRK